MKCISFYTLHACSKYMYLWIHISDMPSASSPENVSWGGSLGAIGASESARGWGAACDLRRVTTMVSHVWCKYQFLNEGLHQAETHVSPAFCWWDTSKQTIFDCNLWNLRWLWHIHGHQSLSRKDDGFTHISSTISVEAGHWHAESHPVKTFPFADWFVLSIPLFGTTMMCFF